MDILILDYERSEKNLPRNVKPVFLHPSTVVQGGLKTGNMVLVNDCSIRTVWPGCGLSIHVIAFPPGDTAVRRGGLCKVQAVTPDTLREVRTADVTLRDPPPRGLLGLLAQSFRREFCDTALLPDSDLRLDFYGKSYTLHIQRMTSRDVPAPAGDDSVALSQLYRLCPDSEVNIRAVQDSLCPQSQFVGAWDTVLGMDLVKRRLLELCDLAAGRQGALSPRSVLLHGVAGTGKTRLGRALAARVGNGSRYCDGSTLWLQLKAGDVTAADVMTPPAAGARVLVLDDLDMNWPRKEKSQDARRSCVILSQVITSLTEQAGIIVVGISSKLDGMDETVRKLFRYELEVPVPNSRARCDILARLLVDTPHSLTQEEMTSLGPRTQGYVGEDLRRLLQEACLSAHARAGELGLPDVQRALHVVKPSAVRELVVTVPAVRWRDVGGQEALKLQLQQSVEWPLTHPQAFARLGVRPPRGLLMYGPPGCSKTLIAKALACESGLSFIAIKGPELFSKWVGESERAVRELFQKARAAAPVIIFFDELDALAPERSSSAGGGEVGDRVLAQLLTEIDGVEALDDVSIIAATNRPDKIDKALLRPGRLDRIVYVPLPDAKAREQIFQIHLRKTPTEDDVDPTSLSHQTDGFSGAEVAAVCHEAAMCALERSLTARTVTSADFAAALEKVRPRTNQATIDFYQNFAQSFEKLTINK